MLAEKFPLLTKSMGAMESHMIENCTRDTPGCDRPGCPSKKDLYSQLPQKVMMRAALSERQLKQVVAEFWRNHFSVNQRLQSNKMCFSTVDWEENVIQKHSMGKFRDLLLASAHHPTMLEYLDNWLSKNGAHNENYARELMELHTLGVDSYYNESDVLELTKALTGWQFKWDRNAKNGRSLVYYFNTSHHNGAPKKLLGRPISGGYKGGIYAVSMLAAHPGTANYISYKLCRYFVNDNPPPAMVRRIASVFRASNGDLPKVYKAILTSPEFWNRKNYRAKFKTPFEFAVSSLRVTNAKIDNAHTAASFLDLMGQPIYQCADPTGYYDQAEAWLDSGVLTRRWDYALQMSRSSLKGVSVPGSFIGKYEKLESDKMKGQMVSDIIGADIGDRTKKLLDTYASHGTTSALGIVIGSPAFQQQ